MSGFRTACHYLRRAYQSPGGRAPDETDHVSGATPFVASSVVEGYLLPTTPFGTDGVTIDGGMTVDATGTVAESEGRVDASPR